MGDHLIYEDAVSTELYTTSEFTSKQYLYVNDNNNGSYSSQIVLDTTSLSNSGELHTARVYPKDRQVL